VPKFVADSSVSPTGLKWAVDPVADVVTTAGDLLYGTAADTVARLGIGTASQVLAVNSGATAPEWVTPAAGGGALVFINSTAFTSAASVSLPASTFTATYENYLLIFDTTAISTNMTVTGRLRSSGSDDTTSNYHNMQYRITNGNSDSTVGNAAVTSFDFAFAASTKPYQGLINVQSPFPSKQTVTFIQLSTQNSLHADRMLVQGGGQFGATTSFDSFSFIASTGNFTGTVRAYGYVNS
jgi:hypothetical protein